MNYHSVYIYIVSWLHHINNLCLPASDILQPATDLCDKILVLRMW